MIISIYPITTVVYEIRQYSTNIHTIRFTLKQEEQRPRIYDYTKRTIRCVWLWRRRDYIYHRTQKTTFRWVRDAKGVNALNLIEQKWINQKKLLGSNLTIYSLALVVAVTQLEIVGIVVGFNQDDSPSECEWLMCVCVHAQLFCPIVCANTSHTYHMCVNSDQRDDSDMYIHMCIDFCILTTTGWRLSSLRHVRLLSSRIFIVWWMMMPTQSRVLT